MRPIFTILLFMVVNHIYSQINTFYVEPIQTDANYSASDESHLVVRNTAMTIDKLFLFIGGSYSKPSSYQGISRFAGELGFDVINLSYKNNVTAASLADDPDSLAFNKYRQHICYGTPLTTIQVDSLNSIYTRALKLIHYLDSTYPDQNWGQYLEDASSLNWDKIAVGGHSQGAGHACYFGKFEPADRVLMFAGPNDYSDYFSSPADWLATPGVTPLFKHFSYLHLYDDVVDYSKQLSNLQSLGLFPLYDSIHIENSTSPYENLHCLYMSNTTGFFSPHSKPIVSNSTNDPVWTYMLSSEISTGVHIFSSDHDITIYPNPFDDKLVIDGSFSDYQIILIDSSGHTVSDFSNESNPFIIDLSVLGSGVYFISLQHQSYPSLSVHKIIKY